MKTLLLSMDNVKELLSMKEVIDAVKEGYLAFEQEKCNNQILFLWKWQSTTEKWILSPVTVNLVNAFPSRLLLAFTAMVYRTLYRP